MDGRSGYVGFWFRCTLIRDLRCNGTETANTSHCCFLARVLNLSLPNRLVWEDARVTWPPTNEALQARYLDNYALGFDRYKQALATNAVKLPSMELLTDQASAMAPKIDPEGRMALDSPGDKMERELNALCLCTWTKSVHSWRTSLKGPNWPVNAVRRAAWSRSPARRNRSQ